jgi:preprotein translocase subunit YajC
MKKFLFLLPVFSIASLFAEDAAPAPKGNYMQTLIMIAVALVFFYFILLRPEQKRRKQALNMRESMKKGDRVTAMGILGTIDQVKESTVILTMIDGAKLEVLKAAISEVKKNETEIKA